MAKGQGGLTLANSDNQEMIELEESFDGEQYMPGARPTFPKDLVTEVHGYETAKRDHQKLTKALTERKSGIIQVFKKHKNLFHESADGKEFTLDVGGVPVTVTVEEEVTISTKVKKAEKKERKPKVLKPGEADLDGDE